MPLARDQRLHRRRHAPRSPPARRPRSPGVRLLGAESRADRRRDIVGIGNGEDRAERRDAARRRSRSAPRRRRRPRCRSSGRGHAGRHEDIRGRDPPLSAGSPVLHPRPFTDKGRAGEMAGFKSDFMRIVHERGMVHQCSDAARLDELLASGIRTAYIGFDCTADSLHVGLSAADHDAALVAEDRPQADRADGRRHHQGRRSLGPRRDAPAPDDEQIDANMAGIRQMLRQVPQIRQRPDRRGDGQQRRLARHAALHPAAARCRPALLGQSHADHGLGEAAARARPAAHLPRIQLHDPAVLRLRGAAQAPQLHPADGRLGPVGQHRHGRRSRPPHGGRRAVRADHAADRAPRRAPRWARPQPARCGSTPSASRPTTSGSTGATPRTTMSAAS